MTWTINNNRYKEGEFITDFNIAMYLKNMFVKTKKKNKDKFYNQLIFLMSEIKSENRREVSCFQEKICEKISFGGRLDHVWQCVNKQNFDLAFNTTENIKESIEKRLTPIQGNYKSLTTNLENIQGATKQYMSQCSEAKIRPMKNDCKEILCSSKSEREIEDLLIQKLLCKEECPIVKNNIPQEKCFKKK
ncbi:hypothetical protein IPH67_02475 [bacterium]|nr:MAG: hypothetical protein IPH67_02475 [bacterium]